MKSRRGIRPGVTLWLASLLLATSLWAQADQNPDLIRMTQERAVARLAGAPALPKYRSPAERSRL